MRLKAYFELFALYATGKINNIFCGFGGGLIGVGALQLARAVKYHTNDEYKEKVDTEKTMNEIIISA